jgi:predicted metal-dependent enzyme (double-stranded beta helix superfamily)
MSTTVAPLLEFVRRLHALVTAPTLTEAALLTAASVEMKTLLATDGWLGEEYARPDPQRYQQYLLYGDPLERFSVVSFVWGPGQATPIHDHTVWGLVGVLRGAEYTRRYRVDDGRLVADGIEQRCVPGDIVAVSPALGDIHVVRNAYPDRVSVSIHVYGGNIGRIRRHVFDPVTGERKPFVSGYASAQVPNLWPSSR